MIEIGEAQKRVLEDVPVLGHERIHIVDALGRVLAQDVRAIRDVPARDNSAMDGYACRYEDIAGADSTRPVSLRIIGESRAGALFDGEVREGEAVSIMTGTWDSACKVRHTSRPSILGSIRSNRTKSGCLRRASARASSPS